MLWHDTRPATRTVEAPPPIPVTVTAAQLRDVPVYLDGLGTVQALNTISIRAQIDGKLQSVDFVEGREVNKGDTLAVIEPAPFKAALDQAVAKKMQDQAQLIGADKDLTRFKDLAARAFGTQQSVDQQQAKVDQLKAMIEADEAAIESARVQLGYTTIAAPIDGRVGFRQVDAGNIIHANDPTPLTVLTQIRPVTVIFTLPQGRLTAVREAMVRGKVPVEAFDQDNTRQLADGELMLIDNQIDQTTSTIRLKATFPNDDGRLLPGEFVHVRVKVDTRNGAVTIPATALQRGPNGFYTWVIKPDRTADQRAIEAMPMGDLAVVTKGLTAGEPVVVNGQYRLQAGARVDARADTANAAVPP